MLRVVKENFAFDKVRIGCIPSWECLKQEEEKAFNEALELVLVFICIAHNLDLK